MTLEQEQIDFLIEESMRDKERIDLLENKIEGLYLRIETIENELIT